MGTGVPGPRASDPDPPRTYTLAPDRTSDGVPNPAFTAPLPGTGLRLWEGRRENQTNSRPSTHEELGALRLALRRLLYDLRDRFGANSTLFYFTDSSSTYHLATAGHSRSPILSALLGAIRCYSCRLGCRLRVVHSLSRKDQTPYPGLPWAGGPTGDRHSVTLSASPYGRLGLPRGVSATSVIALSQECFACTLHSTSSHFLLYGMITEVPTGWTRVATPPPATAQAGSPPSQCGACGSAIRKGQPYLFCHFRTTGFPLTTGAQCRPCQVRYHRGCVRIGPPFQCRTRDSQGLRFPAVTDWPLFVCECCTVRAVLGRELGASGDRLLLRLERVRILDVANSWSQGTFRAYKTKLKFLRKIEGRHQGLTLLARPSPQAPPTESVGLAWAELLYSLRPSSRPDRDTVAFGTVRQIRSAAGWYNAAGALLASSGLAYDERSRRISRTEVGPTDEAILTRFTEGLKRRIGDNPRPSWALLQRHVRAADRFFNEQWAAVGPAHRLEWALAGLANTLLWLGWLRATELLDLRWCDIVVVRPDDGPSHDLPAGVGCLLLRLNPITKTNPHHTADVPVAYRTRDGLTPGVWFARALSAASHSPASIGYVFTDPLGRRWTSETYRSGYLYPLLRSLARDGDAYLSPFTSRARSNGLSLEEAFYSLHCYRRGARTYVELPRPAPVTQFKPTRAHIYEHARWTKSRTGEQIDVIYRQWPLYERLKITLLGM